MKLKVSEYTPFLFIGLLIVIIARHFYNPLNMTDGWDMMNQNGNISIPEPVAQAILAIFLPVMMSMMALMTYMFEVMKAMNESKLIILFMAEFTCFGYLIITYCLEKFHAHWHEEEGIFAMCVDMLCIENIVLYIFTLLSYAISRLFQNAGIPDEVYGILAFLLALPMMWGFLFQMLYFMIEFCVGVAVPGIIATLLANVIGERAAVWIMLALLVLFSQVIWRLCSEVIYNKLLDTFSFHRLSLLD